MKERQRYKLDHPVHVMRGDIFKCSIQDRGTKKQISFRELITKEFIVDTLVTFDVPEDEPTLGVVNGIGAVFGKAVKN